MKYDRYEIKKVEHLKSMSQETECFNLDLYVDGQKFASVSNRGHGGSHDVHPYKPFTYADIREVTEQMKADSFLVDSDFEPFDMAVSTLLALHLQAKDIARICKKKAVFLLDGEMNEMGYKGARLPDQALFDHVKTNHPEAVVLNGMDPAAAAKLVIETDRASYNDSDTSDFALVKP